jgi:predicted NAD-dependent protein-ADP-ribosyltransferase YbiA (DUF1768 family)
VFFKLVFAENFAQKNDSGFWMMAENAQDRLERLLGEFRDSYGHDRHDVEYSEDAFDALLEIVETVEEVHDDTPAQTFDSTSSVGLTLFESFPLDYDGVVYNTAFNAFQAQKAAPDKRSAFCDVDTQTALKLGRECTIDVAAWDADRVNLMTRILKKQAVQNAEFKTRILAHGGRTDIVHNDMRHDPFWNVEMSGVWKAVHSYLNGRKQKRARNA